MIRVITAQLPPYHPWLGQIHYFDSIESTNTQAKAMAINGAPHGTVLLANSQTGGRGRMGRSFQSPPDSGIYMSVILRPNCLAGQLMHLTCATATAAVEAISASTGFRPGIKWTNDLVAGKRKLGGILTELSASAKGQVDWVVVGIGINCTQEEADFHPDIQDIATSLHLCTEKTVDRAAVAAALIAALEKMDRTLPDANAFLPRYRADCITIGKEISILRGEEIRHGHALDVNDQGALLVQFSDGHREFVQSGEVSIRGMYGYV